MRCRPSVCWLAVIMTVVYLSRSMGLDFSGMVDLVAESEYGKIFEFSSWNSGNHFIQHFLPGCLSPLP